MASRKTEDLAFEVAGRVGFVIGPGTDVEGHIYDADRKQIGAGGAVLGRLDTPRYEFDKTSIQTQIEVKRNTGLVAQSAGS